MVPPHKPGLQQLADLRAALPDLAFDPAKDEPVSQTVLAGDYLRFYSLDFDNRYFQRFGRVILDHYTIACHYWLPDKTATPPQKGMVMVVHGYFDHVGLYHQLIRFLLEKGYGVVAFDLPGHGLSSGERASIATFDHYVDVFEAILDKIQQRIPGAISAIGQSTGGAILLKHLGFINTTTPLQKVSLLAPLVEPRHWWFNNIVYLLTHRFRSRIKRFFIANSSDDAFLRFLKNDPLQASYIPVEWIGAMRVWVSECKSMKPSDFPVTILQGDCDTTLAWRTNIKLLKKKFPDSSLIMIKGAGHHMVNEKDDIRKLIFEQMGF